MWLHAEAEGTTDIFAVHTGMDYCNLPPDFELLSFSSFFQMAANKWIAIICGMD